MVQQNDEFVPPRAAMIGAEASSSTTVCYDGALSDAGRHFLDSKASCLTGAEPARLSNGGTPADRLLTRPVTNDSCSQMGLAMRDLKRGTTKRNSWFQVWERLRVLPDS
jgi:hypothetical protein